MRNKRVENLTEFIHLDKRNPFYKEITLIHSQACENQQTFYIDPQTGLSVFTAYYHKLRGFCCGSGCRHCPYQNE